MLSHRKNSFQKACTIGIALLLLLSESGKTTQRVPQNHESVTLKTRNPINMKKSVLFAIFATIVMGLNKVNAQASCPVILNQTFHFNVDQSDPCIKSISFDFYNPTNGDKRIKVIVKVNNVEVVNNCVDASGQMNVQRNYTSPTFTACSYVGIVVTVTPYTGINCLGAGCGATLSSSNGSPLPVIFGAFTATKSNSSVVLKWETLTEINNSGFAIERNTN